MIVNTSRRVTPVIQRYAPLGAEHFTRRLYRTLRPRAGPSERVVDLPDDVADAEGLRAALADTDIFGPSAREAHDYLFDSFERFRVTMALVPELPPQAKVLELGANPYFVTRLLLRRGLDVTCANWFGENSGHGRKGTQIVTGPVSGERHVFDFDHFNVETDPFPYGDGAFDLVLCCEILEHLPNDPTHVLSEIHRVTAKGTGTLILTTPNAVRYDNLIRMQQGENVYEELSGYGTYGRHNREYTVSELQDLLSDVGYEVLDVFAVDVHPRVFPHRRLGPEVELANRGDNLFVVARPVGEPRWRYPRWLYTSQHAIRRVVRPDLVMGYNDDLQTAGFHDLETVGGMEVRWMGAAPTAQVTLEAPDPSQKCLLRVQGLAAPVAVGGETVLTISTDETSLSWSITDDGEPFVVEAPVELDPGPVDLELAVDPTFVPRQVGLGEDTRALGVAISRIWLDAIP